MPEARRPPEEVAAMTRRRVTFSRNLTLSLSRTCQCYCKYCAFATHQPHLHEPEDVLENARPRGKTQRQGAAGADRRATGGQPDRGGAPERLGSRGLRLLRVLGVRAGARTRAASAHEPRRARAGGLRALEARHRLAGIDAGVDRPGPRRPSGLSDQTPAPAAGRDTRRRRAPDPVHERHPRRDRRDPGKTASRRCVRWPGSTPSTVTSRR